MKIPFACAAAGGVLGLGGTLLCMLTPLSVLFFGAPTGIMLCAVCGWEVGVRWKLRHGSGSHFRLHADTLLSVASSICGLIAAAVICLIVAVQPKGTFHEQGGMIITLFVLPVMLALWVAAGPVAFVTGRRALTGRLSIDSEAGHPLLIWAGYILGLVTTIGGVVGVCFVILAVVFG